MRKVRILQLYLGLALAEGVSVLAVFSRVPSDAEHSFLFNFSITRLAILAAVAVLLAGLGWLLINSLRGMPQAGKYVEILDGVLGRRPSRIAVLISCSFILAAWLILFVQPVRSLGAFANYYFQSLPLLNWAAAAALQTIVALLLWREIRVHWDELSQWKGVLQAAAWSLAVMLLAWLWIARTGMGVAPDRGGWYPPGTPILLSQVCLAWGMGMALIVFRRPLDRGLNWLQAHGLRFARADVLIGLFLWIAAGLYWWVEPVQRPSYFSPTPVAPNFDAYPYADAAEYDINAHNILLGYGRVMGLIRRPLYSFLLSLFHLISGEEYRMIQNLQSLFLAVIPVLLFLLTTALSNRAAGLTAALMIVFRERNSIALTNVIEVSHSKLLMSDVPAMAMVLMFTLLCVLWLRKKGGSGPMAFAAGGALGLTMLIRSQALLIVPVVLLCAVPAYQKQSRRLLLHALVFVAGAGIVIAPWLVRNHQLSGKITVENADLYLPQIASAYYPPYPSLSPLQDETESEFRTRLQRHVLDVMVTRPAEVLRFYAVHFFHNEVSSVIYLPLSIKFYETREYVRHVAVWSGWQGYLPGESISLLFINLVLIALGAGAAWRRSGTATLTVLMIHATYSLSLVPFRLSGWRLILPVDWVSSVFYAIGLVQFVLMAASLFPQYVSLHAIARPPVTEAPGREDGAKSRFQPVILSTIFFLVGFGFTAVSWFIPQRPVPFPSTQAVMDYLADEDFPRVDAIPGFLAQDEAVLLSGSALYPRYYRAGRGLSDRAWPEFQVRDFNRLGFYLTGPEGPAHVVLALDNSPEMIPNASDVIVIGCRTSDHIAAVLVLVPSRENLILYRARPDFPSCAPE